jgi:hypothetical protein
MKRLAALSVSMAVVGLTLAAGPAGAAVARGSDHEAHHRVGARTWTVTPGGTTSAKSGTVTIEDTTTGAKIICKQSTSTITFKSGSGLPGTHIAKISHLMYNSCGGVHKKLTLKSTVERTVKPSGGHPEVNAESFGGGGRTIGGGSLVTGTITGIGLTVSTPGCSASITGPGEAVTGRVAFSYANATGKLTVEAAGGTLQIANVSGCLGLLNDGDPATISTTYTVTPMQTITSP